MCSHTSRQWRAWLCLHAWIRDSTSFGCKRGSLDCIRELLAWGCCSGSLDCIRELLSWGAVRLQKDASRPAIRNYVAYVLTNYA
ncbi:hypothetical protein L1987_70397 [Smallanthus sonchifolius]|uniref:Uncharacterized protein n=1 Tax=Smallanthus sonchifolius TaxID=185202 RepID=A0ACB9AQ64_9ASTR|nr:hypothetical protein L1987_70397 [Smallanthus sonchifolius]